MNESSSPHPPIRIFLCYSHQDRELLEQLLSHLKLLERQKIIDAWYDRDISPGANWSQEINDHLENAQIVLLLVSNHFLSSDYCWDIEMKRAMQKYEAGEALVIPIILKPVDWVSAPFGKLQALPEQGTPVVAWDDQDEAWLCIARSLRTACAWIRRRSEGTENSSPDSTPGLSKVFPIKFRVYHFDNWGVLAKMDNIGEYFSDLILSHLLKKHLQAASATETPPPDVRVDFHPVRTYYSGPDWPHKDLAPFMCVTGSVKDFEGLLTAHVRFSYIDAQIYTHVLLNEEYRFSNRQEEMQSAAREIAEKIYSLLLDMETPEGWSLKGLRTYY